MNPKYGADGILTFLAIIEKDGSMSNEHCLGSVGKTNCTIGLSYLKKLTPWKPAIELLRSKLMENQKTVS
ncbi:MAG: hypothetical protein AB8H03_23905 [Saprospiraceae bacterium]